jgi:hypothetical protein
MDIASEWAGILFSRIIFRHIVDECCLRYGRQANGTACPYGALLLKLVTATLNIPSWRPQGFLALAPSSPRECKYPWHNSEWSSVCLRLWHKIVFPWDILIATVLKTDDKAGFYNLSLVGHIGWPCLWWSWIGSAINGCPCSRTAHGDTKAVFNYM